MENWFQEIIFCGLLSMKIIIFMEPRNAEKTIVIFALIF